MLSQVETQLTAVPVKMPHGWAAKGESSGRIERLGLKLEEAVRVKLCVELFAR